MYLWQEYIKERQDAKMICLEVGFITYRELEDDSIFICDFFVLPEHRKNGIGNKLVDMLIERENPKVLYASSDTDSLNWEQSHRFIINWGLEELGRDEETVYYGKEIR
jgi:ribosomal protein S18 acetylase RimI-like enzyme